MSTQTYISCALDPSVRAKALVKEFIDDEAVEADSDCEIIEEFEDEDYEEDAEDEEEEEESEEELESGGDSDYEPEESAKSDKKEKVDRRVNSLGKVDVMVNKNTGRGRKRKTVIESDAEALNEGQPAARKKVHKSAKPAVINLDLSAKKDCLPDFNAHLEDNVYVRLQRWNGGRNIAIRRFTGLNKDVPGPGITLDFKFLPLLVKAFNTLAEIIIEHGGSQ